MQSRPIADRDDGVTLIELLVVVVVFAVVGTVTVAGVVTAFQSSVDTRTRIEARQELELAVQQMTRVLRGADGGSNSGLIVGANPASELGSEFFFGGERRTSFFAVEGDLSTPSTGSRLVQCEGSSCAGTTNRQLVTNVDNDLTEVAGIVAEPVFEYLDRSGAVVSPGDASIVQVRLIRALDGRNPVVVETQVAIRSVRYSGE